MIDRRDDVHVLPVNDLREHVTGRACWCRPSLVDETDEGAVVEGAVVVHHALDGREYHEPDHVPMETVQ